MGMRLVTPSLRFKGYKGKIRGLPRQRLQPECDAAIRRYTEHKLSSITGAQSVNVPHTNAHIAFRRVGKIVPNGDFNAGNCCRYYDTLFVQP